VRGLDAIGAVGIARAFAICGEIDRPFYDPSDPFARRRPVDDRRFGLDHFFQKLLRIAAGLHTEAARRRARPRVEIMEQFLAAFEAEIA
jgi:uncharacterized protein